jgi:hypothetical protein
MDTRLGGVHCCQHADLIYKKPKFVGCEAEALLAHHAERVAAGLPACGLEIYEVRLVLDVHLVVAGRQQLNGQLQGGHHVRVLVLALKHAERNSLGEVLLARVLELLDRDVGRGKDLGAAGHLDGQHSRFEGALVEREGEALGYHRGVADIADGGGLPGLLGAGGVEREGHDGAWAKAGGAADAIVKI